MKLVVLLSLVGISAFADFSYNSTSQVTGGALMRMANMPIPGMGEAKKALLPTVSRVSIKGDRMIHKSEDSATITDLSKGTITSIDYKARTYSVVTFDQMRELMEAISAKSAGAGIDANWEFKVDPTGRTQKIDGYDCREVILSMKAGATDQKSGQSGSFVMNSVMWQTKSVPGDQEFRDFHQKMAQKMKLDPSSLGNFNMGGFGKGMAELQAKAKEMDGITILQLTTVGANADGLPKSIDVPETTEALKQQDEERARQQKQQTAAQNEAVKAEAADAAVATSTEAGQVAIRDSMGKYGNVAAGALGRFGGLGRKKAKAAPSEPPPAPVESASASSGKTQSVDTQGVMMQLRITETDFSTASVDSSLFEIPAGFKEVESSMMKQVKK